MKCSCANDGHCHPATGHCSCAPGWTGLSCQRGRRHPSPLPGRSLHRPSSPLPPWCPRALLGPTGDGALLQPVTAGTGVPTAATSATAVPAVGAATPSAACVCARPATRARDASSVSPARPEAVCVHVHPHAHRHVSHMHAHPHTCTHAHTCTHPHVYTPAHMHPHTCTCPTQCIHAHIRTPCTQTHACHTHVYTHVPHAHTLHNVYIPACAQHAPACTDTCTYVPASMLCNRCTHASVGEPGLALLSPEEQGFCSPELTSSPPSPSPCLPPPGPSSRLTWGSRELRDCQPRGAWRGACGC